jgi:hypothetical protein
VGVEALEGEGEQGLGWDDLKAQGLVLSFMTA